MGVRLLIGEADGTTPAAALYDSATGLMLGGIIEAPDAAEQAEAFLQWLTDRGWRGLPYRPLAARQGMDARDWAQGNLQRLYTAWRRRAVNPDTGRLAAEEEVAP